MPFQFTCETCGTTFARHNSYPKRYCSRACRFAPQPGFPQPDGSVLVPLSKGQFATIDAEDAERILAFKWCVTNHGYAVRRRGIADGPGPSLILMHREILRLSPDQEGDHINGARLDNRRSNLRAVTGSENNMNRRKRHGTNTSGYRGVTWRKDMQKWAAQLHVGGKHVSLGFFDDPVEAANARDAAARELHGEFAVLNFPDSPANVLTASSS